MTMKCSSPIINSETIVVDELKEMLKIQEVIDDKVVDRMGVSQKNCSNGGQYKSKKKFEGNT